VLVNGVTDTAGNRFPFFGVLGFRTGFATDSTGPSLVQTSPSDGDLGVPLNAKVTLQFSERMNATTRRSGLRVTTADGVNVGGTFTFSDTNRIVTFEPSAPLAPETVYMATYTADLKDSAGNPLLNPGTFSFKSGTATDLVAPFVTEIIPANGARRIGRNMAPRVAFSEAINPITVSRETLRLVDASTGQLIRATVTVAADRRSATLRPAAPLQPDTTYFVGLASFSFADTAGNLNFGLFTSFTTGTVEDAEAPAVVAISPPDGARGVPINARVVLRFDELIDPLSVSETTIVLVPPAAGEVRLASDGVTVTFTPS